MAFNLVFEWAIDQSTWLGSFDYYARVNEDVENVISVFFFFIYFSFPNPNPSPFISSFLPSFSFSIRIEIRSNDFYVIKKYFGLSIFILITSWQTFKWETKIISFVYLPCLEIIVIVSIPAILYFRSISFQDYDVKIRMICEISTIEFLLTFFFSP